MKKVWTYFAILQYETGTGHNGTAKGRKRLRMDRMPQ